MAIAESSNPLCDLARTADAIADRVRPWLIGHELANVLTADGRRMTTEEVALVQALERNLDWSDDGTAREFRAWWLDEDTSLAEADGTWPAVWASVADFAKHPTIVAHLCDLLWLAQHGTPHLHARRAVDAYVASSELLTEVHDRSRSLIRAHELAGAINDPEQLRLTEERLCAATNAVTAGDISVALALLEHLLRRPLHSEAAATASDLLNRAWRAATRGDHVERLAKLLLRRTDNETDRLAIADRVVAAFRARAAQEEGLGRLIALRDAQRVAEELGHAAHDEILHEIETMDSESAFTPIRTEHVLSRQHVATFCTEVVGGDSLAQALTRFAHQLFITPASVQQVRENMPISIRHMITNFRVGEANSIVTSTATTSPDQDHIVAALERDVLQTVGRQAEAMAFLFLVPALHQTLASYEPWTIADARAVLEAGPADAVVADALARSLRHFHNRCYDEAVHVALPRVERLVRLIARNCGVATTKRPTKRVGGIRGLGEILVDLRGDADRPILPEPALTAIELTLVDPDALNLRNEFLHGMKPEARASEAALVLQLGLALALLIRIGPEDSFRSPQLLRSPDDER